MSFAFEDFGRTEIRPRGSLSVRGPRELLVTRGIRGAFEPSGDLAVDTIRFWGDERVISDSIPDRLPDESVVDVCDEEVVWGGSILRHYGHFLTEGVSRLWPLLPGGPLEGLRVVFTTPLELAFTSEWIEAFGLQVLSLPQQGIVRFTKMHVPDPAWRLNAWVTPEVREVHLHARQGLNASSPSRHGVLWLSRSGWGLRGAYDELLLEWLLGEHITVFRPETMRLAEQVGGIEASEAVAGIIGSAFHTMLLASNVPDCIYLCPPRFQSAHAVQGFVVGKEATFAHALHPVSPRRGGKTPPRRNRVSIPDALQVLSATVLPDLVEDSTLGPLMRPERLSGNGHWGCDGDLDSALVEVLLDPYSVTARIDLGLAFKERGLVDCALEQFAMVEGLT